MPKQIEIKNDNFSGGIADDVRKVSGSEFIISKHFDIFSNPKRLTPYRSFEVDHATAIGATDLRQYFVRDFLYPSGSGKLYGLGQTAGGLTKILQKDLAESGLWATPASSEGNGAVQNGCLVEYKNYAWGFQGTTQVFRWGLLSGTPAITNSQGTVGTITSVAQGVIALDDNLYLPYNNKLVRVNAGGTVQDAILTLPTNFKITSICNFGKYLAIACAPISTFNGVSKVFIWNLTSPDVQEVVDWGEGELRVIETIEGMIVGITDRYLNNATGAGRGSMIIQGYSGGIPQVLKEVFTLKLTGKTMPISKAVKNNRLFFSAKIMTNEAGTEYDEGIWSFGRKNANYPWALTLDLIDENVTVAGIQAFGSAANFFFIAYNNDGSVDKTNDVATYAFTSIYDSLIQEFGDVEMDKRLDNFKVSFRKLASGESITVKVKVDDAVAFTTIGSFSTVGALTKTFNVIESTGLAFPSGKEFKFRIESTGGAEITSWTARATPLSTI